VLFLISIHYQLAHGAQFQCGIYSFQFPNTNFGDCIFGSIGLSRNSYKAFSNAQIREEIMKNHEMTKNIILAIWEVIGRDRISAILSTTDQIRQVGFL